MFELYSLPLFCEFPGPVSNCFNYYSLGIYFNIWGANPPFLFFLLSPRPRTVLALLLHLFFHLNFSIISSSEKNLSIQYDLDWFCTEFTEWVKNGIFTISITVFTINIVYLSFDLGFLLWLLIKILKNNLNFVYFC